MYQTKQLNDMTFKQTTKSDWKMNHENYTAYIHRCSSSYYPTFYLSITVETFDGQYYETKQLITEKEFNNLNEAKRFAKENV